MAWKFVGRRAWSGSATSSKGEPAGAVCRTIHGLDCGSRRSRGQVDSRRHMGRPSLPAPSAAAAPCAREPPTAGGGRGDGKVQQRRAARYHPATAAAAVRDGQKKRPSIRSPAYFAACAEMQKMGRDAGVEYGSRRTVELLITALEAVGAKHCCRRTSAQMNKA